LSQEYIKLSEIEENAREKEELYKKAEECRKMSGLLLGEEN